MHETRATMHKSQPLALDIQSAGCYMSSQGVGKPLHSHPVWEIVYYLQGSPRCRVGDEIIDASPQTILVLPPGTPHGEITQRPWACYYLLLKNTTFAEGPILVHDDHTRSIYHVCASVVREWRSDQQDREVMLSHLLGQLAILLRRLNPPTAPSVAEMLVRQFEYVLEERFTGPVSISRLSREIGVSCSYLRAQFVRLRGQTPMQRLQQLRAQHALTVIQNSSESLEIIAETCGYASASHLSRHIKRATGKAPGEFRLTERD